MKAFESKCRSLNLARQEGRNIKFGLNAFIIVRDSEAEAQAVLRDIIAQADKEAVEGFGSAVQQAGASTHERVGMWANSGLRIWCNITMAFAPFDWHKRTVAERIQKFHEVGVDLI